MVRPCGLHSSQGRKEDRSFATPTPSASFNCYPQYLPFIFWPTHEYACGAWGGLGKRDALRPEHLQRSAARVIAKVSASDNLSSDLLLARAGLEPLSLRQTVVLASTLYRLSSDPPKGPPHHRNDFQNWIAAAPRPSRCSILRSSVKNYLSVPRPRTELLRLSPFYRGVSLLNSISTEARASLAALKSFILSSPDCC